MRSDMNDFVPMDDLNWNPASRSFQILSDDDQRDIIEACVSSGMKNPKDIVRVVREYETVKGGTLLFKNFVAGRLGICGFDDDGSPIFESRNEE